MAANQRSERWWLVLAVAVLLAIVLLTRLSHRLTRSGAPSAPAADLIPVPSDPPTAQTLTELQARNKGLHWAAVDSRTVMIITPHGACGTLTAIGPTQVNFHTGRDYDRQPHLFSAWADAYTAAEQYCQTWAATQNPHP